jgi:hypothetical protein
LVVTVRARLGFAYHRPVATRQAVRLPLQIGSSSLFNLALGAGLLLPGLLAPVWWTPTRATVRYSALRRGNGRGEPISGG